VPKQEIQQIHISTSVLIILQAYLMIILCFFRLLLLTLWWISQRPTFHLQIVRWNRWREHILL